MINVISNGIVCTWHLTRLTPKLIYISTCCSFEFLLHVTFKINGATLLHYVKRSRRRLVWSFGYIKQEINL